MGSSFLLNTIFHNSTVVLENHEMLWIAVL